MTAPGLPSSASGNPAAPAHANRDTARRVLPLFRPYRAQVAAVVGLIVVTSTIGIINPLLIQTVFNKALFVPGGPTRSHPPIGADYVSVSMQARSLPPALAALIVVR